jgi:hypothetical protein
MPGTRPGMTKCVLVLTSPQSRRRLVMTLIAAAVRHAITDAETGAPAPCHDQANAA